MKNIIGMVPKPSQRAIDGAADQLNTTAVGGAFVLQFFLMAGLVWYIVRQSTKEKEAMRLDAKEKTTATNVILASKDKMLEAARKDMQEVALDSMKIGTIVTERIDRVLDSQEDILKIMRKEGNGGNTSDPDGR